MKGNTKKSIKTRCNLVCMLCGFIDKIFGRIHINENGEAVSGFIAGRKESYVKKVSLEIDDAQSKINDSRAFADKQISQFSEKDVGFLCHTLDTPAERRHGQKIIKNIDSLFNVNNSIKENHVTLLSSLDNDNAEFKRQLTAYLIAGISRKKKKTLDIEKNVTISHEDLAAYTTYLECYNYVDEYIEEFVNAIVNCSDKIAKIKEE